MTRGSPYAQTVNDVQGCLCFAAERGSQEICRDAGGELLVLYLDTRTRRAILVDGRIHREDCRSFPQLESSNCLKLDASKVFLLE